MANERSASVWDALADTPEEADNLRLRSQLMRILVSISLKPCAIPVGVWLASDEAITGNTRQNLHRFSTSPLFI